VSVLRFLGRIDERTVKVEIDLLDMIRQLVGDEPITSEKGDCIYCGSGHAAENIHTMNCVWAEAQRMLGWLETPVEELNKGN